MFTLLYPNPVDIAVGARIMTLRRSRGLGQPDLGRAIGVTYQQVQKYEYGKNRVSASMLLRVAGALETTGSQLLGETGELPAPEEDGLLRAFRRIHTSKGRKAAIAAVLLISGLGV